MENNTYQENISKCPITFLAQYKDIFGKPTEGPHSVRFLDFAVVDIIATIILAIVISYIFNVDLTTTIIFAFIIGEISHYLFCVDTKFIKIIKNFF